MEIIKLKSTRQKKMFNPVRKNKPARLLSSSRSHKRLTIKLYKCCSKIIARDNAIVAISWAMLFVY